MTGSRWRKALLGRAAVPAPGEVPRVVVEVITPGGERGLVTVSLREGRVSAVDDRGERSSALVAAANAWLDGLARAEPAQPGAGEIARDGVRDEPAPGPSLPPGATEDDTLRDLSLAFVRSGVAGAKRGALDEHIRRARSLADSWSSRWTGRFEAALASQDLPTLARLVRGALARPTATLGQRVDSRLVEVGRERLDGVQPRSIERRYLLDLADGKTLVEERLPESALGSIGPMPRTLEVGLAEVWSEPGHATIRVLQYTTSPNLEPTVLARIQELAHVDLALCFDLVDADLRASPGWAEPFVLFAPTSWEAGLAAADGAGRRVPWSAEEDPAACLLLAEVVERAPPRWVAMRACPRRGAHAFVPLACATEVGGETVIHRLRG